MTNTMVCQLLHFFSFWLVLHHAKTITGDFDYEQQRASYEDGQKTLSIVVSDKFEISKKMPIEMTDIVFIGHYKLRFNFACHSNGLPSDKNLTCEDILKSFIIDFL